MFTEEGIHDHGHDVRSLGLKAKGNPIYKQGQHPQDRGLLEISQGTLPQITISVGYLVLHVTVFPKNICQKFFLSVFGSFLYMQM